MRNFIVTVLALMTVGATFSPAQEPDDALGPVIFVRGEAVTMTEVLPNSDIRDAVSSGTSAGRLAELAESRYPVIRSLVAANENTPVAILGDLVRDEHEDVHVIALTVARSRMSYSGDPVLFLEVLRSSTPLRPVSLSPDDTGR